MLFTLLGFGTLGVGLRFGADLLIKLTALPAATFLVNVLGSFLAGWLFTQRFLSPDMRTSALVGFCGGFTTFSALMIQSMQMFRDGDYFKGIGYLMISQLAGLFAAWAGMRIGEL